MNAVLKYVGVFIQLAGVAVLAIPTIGGQVTNTHLAVGLSLIVVGYLVYIVLNKIQES
ncbi:MAG: hypothetical protein LBJ01_10650 [Tannerella sp.]|jgi:hypothetical protein|nr:hypothetical protein [Tannerella sp.]